MNYDEAETICVRDHKKIRRKKWDETGLHPYGQFIGLLTTEDRAAEDWYVVRKMKVGDYVILNEQGIKAINDTRHRLNYDGPVQFKLGDVGYVYMKENFSADDQDTLFKVKFPGGKLYVDDKCVDVRERKDDAFTA